MSGQPQVGPGFRPGLVPPEESDRPAWWFLFRGFRLLVQESDDGVALPLVVEPRELGLTPVRRLYLGRLHDGPAYAAELPDDTQAPAGMVFQTLRQLYFVLDDVLIGVAGRAVQLVDWTRNHQFCGRCGAATERHPDELNLTCPRCGLSHYPRLSPAIIVLIQRGDRILLAHNKRHPGTMYSVLAGFVEPGETLEQAVSREVREEVGLEVQEIRYFGSQPWPFPNSLMIAFTCAYAGGQITLHDNELDHADWFGAGELPDVPPPISIARQLIDWFVAGQSASAGRAAAAS